MENILPLINDFVFNFSNDTNRTLKKSRYDDKIAIFDNNMQQKLSDSNIFIIGAGTLGCEFFKYLALMGVSNNANKKIKITDTDNIEISNLNSLFF